MEAEMAGSKEEAEARKAAVAKYGAKIVKAADEILEYFSRRGEYAPLEKKVIADIILKATKK
jgi:hypothetical protein